MGQDQNPVLTLQAGRSLAGRVVDLEGKPVAGAEVTATLFANPRWNGFTYAEVRTDRDGRYVIKALPQEPNCKASLWVSKQGYDSRDFSVVQAAPVLPTGFVKPGDTVWRTYAVPRVTLEDGRAVTESQDIMLEPADKTITGMVVDAAGKPVAGVHVKASYHAEMEAGSNSGLTMAESGTDGKFVLKGVSRGEYVLQAFSEDYSRQASAKAKGGDRDVRLTLGP
jgi:hypothetical protein